MEKDIGHRMEAGVKSGNCRTCICQGLGFRVQGLEFRAETLIKP